ncbi:universal stress protein [Formosa sp. S-31]|uniref:universal stress protein n=1 Tax=Formosa sp. S-31 TaxID=2790949 RepID=UPI003EC06AF1
MKNILITLNFSENDQRLLDQGYELAKAFKAKLWLMHIAAPNPDFVGYEVGPQYIRDSRASKLRHEHQLLQEYAAAMQIEGVEADGLLIQGATTEMILEESKKLKVDLIIAGYQEHDFIYKALMGNVSSQLIKQSKIPVLIVPLH